MSQKGCKAIKRTLTSETPTKNLWKCIKKIETKTGATVNKDEEKYFIKNLMKADRLVTGLCKGAQITNYQKCLSK